MAKKNKVENEDIEAETPVESEVPPEIVEYIRISLVRKYKGTKKAEELHTEKIETDVDFAALAGKLTSMDSLKEYLRDDTARMKRRKDAILDAKIASLQAKKNGG
jgi:hypothetical protein